MWIPILTAIISVSISVASAWILDTRKEKRISDFQRKSIYWKIFTTFTSESKKEEISAKEFDEYLNQNRHFLDYDIVRIMPSEFNPLCVSDENPDDYNIGKEETLLEGSDGTFHYELNMSEYYARKYYWFTESVQVELWKTIARIAMQRYNALSGENYRVSDEEIYVNLIPDQ